MQGLIQKLKNHVLVESQNPNFKHHKWYLKYHLEIVERISLELCDIYKSADRDMVLLLVWLHDYEKILSFAKQEKLDYLKTKEKLVDFGFSHAMILKIISYLLTIDQKNYLDLKQAAIEVKIVSSADAASHLVGPFHQLWWYENPEKDYEELMADNIKKAWIDWNKKIVLPEIKLAFKDRYELLLEQSGKIPNKFLEL